MWPSHIEHYNPNAEAEAEDIFYNAPAAESDEEMSIEERQTNSNRKKTAQRDPSTIEHYQPSISNDEDESVFLSAQTTQETKRRKVNGSNRPLKLRDIEENNGAKKIREVQVLSEDGTLLNTFRNCAEAARQMGVGRGRINRGKVHALSNFTTPFSFIYLIATFFIVQPVATGAL